MPAAPYGGRQYALAAPRFDGRPRDTQQASGHCHRNARQLAAAMFQEGLRCFPHPVLVEPACCHVREHGNLAYYPFGVLELAGDSHFRPLF